MCAVRSLLPEGDLWNNTLPAEAPELELQQVGAFTIGCSNIGCEQQIFGSCCDSTALPCDFQEVSPQLAIIDSFSSTAFKVFAALCEMLKELDPCTARRTIRKWAERFGIEAEDPCGPYWSDNVLMILICLLLQVKMNVMNWDYLTKLAGQFGASLTLKYAGDMNNDDYNGWWTMARDMTECDYPECCPPDPNCSNHIPMIRLVGCDSEMLSLNLVTCPSDIILLPNCNLGIEPPNNTRPHDPELYRAFRMILPKLLPNNAFWCIYNCNPEDCIT